jgi:putative intracellular protease/amidase
MTLDRRAFLAALSALAVTLPAASRPALAAEPAPISAGDGVDHIGMLVYPGFTALDFVGPHHFLGGMGNVQLHVVTNQPDLAPVSSDLGLAVTPTATLESCPKDLTVLFVPGGTIGTIAAAGDEATLAFVRDRAARARYVTSVCTGSLVLGAAGLLKERRATSHWSVIDTLAQFGAIPVRERVVRDGNVITGAGVSAGLDFGVTLVEELRGRETAEAGVLISEYAPQPPIAGGTIETARPETAEMLRQGLRGFVDMAENLAIRG